MLSSTSNRFVAREWMNSNYHQRIELILLKTHFTLFVHMKIDRYIYADKLFGRSADECLAPVVNWHKHIYTHCKLRCKWMETKWKNLKNSQLHYKVKNLTHDLVDFTWLLDFYVVISISIKTKNEFSQFILYTYIQNQFHLTFSKRWR